MAKEKPWYYAVLPATIRYAEDLTELQKLLYAEITALAQANGYCYASNSYFANLYKKTSKRISSTIQDMAKKWYLGVKQNKEWWWSREIYLGEIKNIRKSFKIPTNPIPLEEDTPIPEKKEGAIPLETDTLSHSTGNIIIQDNTTSVNVEAHTPEKIFLETRNKEIGSNEILVPSLKKGIESLLSSAPLEEFTDRIIRFAKLRSIVIEKKLEEYFYYPICSWRLEEFLKHINKIQGESISILEQFVRYENRTAVIRKMKRDENNWNEEKKEESKRTLTNEEKKENIARLRAIKEKLCKQT